MVRVMTKDALVSAYGGESMAHMRYLIFAKIAEREKFSNVARLFRAVAFAEYVHASNHYKLLRNLKEDVKVSAGATFGPGNTSKNLDLAIMGEDFEVEEMYPAYIEIAKLQGEDRAVRSFKWALEAEKIHSELYKEAKEHVDKKKDLPIKGYVWICPVCGYTYIGEEPPERCPVCGASKDMFEKF